MLFKLKAESSFLKLKHKLSIFNKFDFIIIVSVLFLFIVNQIFINHSNPLPDLDKPQKIHIGRVEILSLSYQRLVGSILWIYLILHADEQREGKNIKSWFYDYAKIIDNLLKDFTKGIILADYLFVIKDEVDSSLDLYDQVLLRTEFECRFFLKKEIVYLVEKIKQKTSLSRKCLREVNLINQYKDEKSKKIVKKKLKTLD